MPTKSRNPATRPTRIAHVITRLELGGAQQNTLYCCQHHDRKKYEVVLVAGEGGLLDSKARVQSPGTTVHLVPWLKHPVRPLQDLIALFRLASLLKREKIQLVHTHSSKAGILGRWAAGMVGVPVVVHTVHGWGFHPRQAAPVRWLYQALERLCAPKTDRLIAVSDENRQYGLSNSIGHAEQYRVIHSGIEAKDFKVSGARVLEIRRQMGVGKRPVVLVLSNFKKQKSPFDVVEVMARLKAKVPNAILVWAGDGPLRPAVEREIAQRGLGGSFKILGWATDVAALLAASDCLLLTSLYEGLPRVVLQAMAAGKPVVATRVSGTPEAVTPGVTGFLREPGDAEGMAQDLARILMNPGLARRLGANGRKGLRGSFQIREMLRQIEQLYESALKAKGVR